MLDSWNNDARAVGEHAVDPKKDDTHNAVARLHVWRRYTISSCAVPSLSDSGTNSVQTAYVKTDSLECLKQGGA